MPRTFLLAILATSTLLSTACADNKVQHDDLRSAAEKALDQIQQSQAISIRKENCASCHHQLLTTIPLALAERTGVKFDAKLAREHTQQTFGLFKEFDGLVQGMFYIDVQFDGWMLAAAHFAGVKPNLTTEAEAQFIAGRQLPDGSWRVMDARPPQSHSQFTCTAVCSKAISAYFPDSLKEEKAARLAKARAWLLKATPKSTEDRAFQLLGLLWTNAVEADRKKCADALIALQRPDGGWSQLPSRDSDAYATGEVLSALHQAGGLATDHEVYQRGLRFLLKTQQQDGTWQVKTRLFPPAPLSPPFFSSGFPYGKDQFVSIMGTTWAVAAMLHAVPNRPEAGERHGYTELAPDVKDEWVRVALSGTADDLKKLLDNGMSPNARTAAGTTALMLAARSPEKVRMLLDRGADAKARAKSGFDALLVASRYYGNGETVKLLLKAGAKPLPEKGIEVAFDASPVFFAATSGDTEVAALLLDAGARLRQRMKMLGKVNAAPAQYAVSTGDAAMLEFLIKRGADPNEVDEDDQISLLGWAAISNQVEALDVLVARGAKVNQKDSFGMTPLLYAASIDHGDTVVIEKLLAAGADPQAKASRGRTALDLAREYRHQAIADRLSRPAPKK